MSSHFVTMLAKLASVSPVAPRRGADPVAGRVTIADRSGRLTIDGRIAAVRTGLIDPGDGTVTQDEIVRRVAAELVAAIDAGALNFKGRPVVAGRPWTDGRHVWTWGFHLARSRAARSVPDTLTTAVSTSVAPPAPAAPLDGHRGGLDTSATPGHLPDAAPRPCTAPEWWEALLASEVLRSRRSRARASINDERLKPLLSLLSERGGRVTLAACASALAVGVGLVPSMVAATSYLLNFDGYEVIALEGDDVVLDLDLLKTQFML